MKTFSPDRGCPKCGNICVETKYDPTLDQMGRRCDGCGHTWQELPLDRADASDNEGGENG